MDLPTQFELAFKVAGGCVSADVGSLKIMHKRQELEHQLAELQADECEAKALVLEADEIEQYELKDASRRVLEAQAKRIRAKAKLEWSNARRKPILGLITFIDDFLEEAKKYRVFPDLEPEEAAERLARKEDVASFIKRIENSILTEGGISHSLMIELRKNPDCGPSLLPYGIHFQAQRAKKEPISLAGLPAWIGHVTNALMKKYPSLEPLPEPAKVEPAEKGGLIKPTVEDVKKVTAAKR